MDHQLAPAAVSGVVTFITLGQQAVARAEYTVERREPDQVVVSFGSVGRPLRVALIDANGTETTLAALGQPVPGAEPVGEVDVAELLERVLDALRDDARRIDCRALIEEARVERRRRALRAATPRREVRDAR